MSKISTFLSNKYAKILIKLLFTIVLLLFVIKKIDIEGLYFVIKHINFHSILTIILLYILAHLLNSVKWKLFIKHVKLGRLVNLTFVSQLYALSYHCMITVLLEQLIRVNQTRWICQRCLPLLNPKMIPACSRMLLRMPTSQKDPSRPAGP